MCFKIYPKMETGTEGEKTWQALSSSEKPEPTKYFVAYQQLNQIEFKLPAHFLKKCF